MVAQIQVICQGQLPPNGVQTYLYFDSVRMSIDSQGCSECEFCCFVFVHEYFVHPWYN